MLTVKGTYEGTTGVSDDEFAGSEPADQFPPFDQPGVPRWSPVPSSGLKAWFKSDSGITLTDGIVTAWKDHSGNGNDASISGGFLGARFDADIINGKPGLNSFYDLTVQMGSTAPNLPDGSPYHVITVVHMAPASAGLSPAGFTVGGGLLNIGDSLTSVFGVYQGDLYISPTVTATGVPVVNDASYLFELASDTITQTAAIDGTDLTLSSTVPMALHGHVWDLFNDLAGGNGPFWGWTCEVLVYDHILTGSDLGQLRVYLNSKYAL